MKENELLSLAQIQESEEREINHNEQEREILRSKGRSENYINMVLFFLTLNIIFTYYFLKIKRGEKWKRS